MSVPWVNRIGASDDTKNRYSEWAIVLFVSENLRGLSEALLLQ